MYLGQSDVELLRLAGWCKHLPADFSKYHAVGGFSLDCIKALGGLRLLNRTQSGESIRLQAKGWRLLQHLGYQYHRDVAYKSDIIGRCLEISRILLTFYRGGYQVFSEKLQDLSSTHTFMTSAALRRGAADAGDLWGGGCFRGIARFRQHTATCYYLTGHMSDAIPLGFERQLLGKAATQLGTGEAMIYAGLNYERLAKHLSLIPPKPKGEKKTFAQILHNASYPIHLLECSDAGALQLRIMAVENYRTRPGPVLFNSAAPPPVGVKDADGAVSSGGVTIPWVSATDMDLWRIGRACRQAEAAGYTRIAMACLAGQAAALEKLFAGDGIKIILVPMKERQLLEAFGLLRLYEPEQGVWTDREGGMLDAAHLPVD